MRMLPIREEVDGLTEEQAEKHAKSLATLTPEVVQVANILYKAAFHGYVPFEMVSPLYLWQACYLQLDVELRKRLIQVLQQMEE